MSAFELTGTGATGATGATGQAELDYVQITSNATSTQTVEASATTIITSNSVSFDGSTAVYLEFFAMGCGTPADSSTVVNFWDGSTNLGQCAFAQASDPSADTATMNCPMIGRLKVTPSNGSHTFTVRLWGGTGTKTIFAGSGGAGAVVPAYLRIVRV